MPHMPSECQLCYYGRNAVCEICLHAPPLCDGREISHEIFHHLTPAYPFEYHSVFVCNDCFIMDPETLQNSCRIVCQARIHGLEPTTRRESWIVLMRRRELIHERLRELDETSRVRVRGVMNPEDDEPLERHYPFGIPELMELGDPMDAIDMALNFIPHPSAAFNNLLTAITSDPSLDPYPPQ